MYVIPFWSYRDVGGRYLIKNWMTDRQIVVSSHDLDLLEAVSGDRSVGHTGVHDAIAMYRDAEIVFDDAAAAERWYAHMESTWQSGSVKVDQIELTNRCPYACKMCPRTFDMTRPLGDLSLSLFERLMTQLQGRQQYVALHHFGESLVHPQIADAVALATAQGISTGLSCNPPSLHPGLGQKLLDSGLANVVLSFDSLDSGTYREIRGQAADFDRGDRNLREFIRARDAGAYRTFVTLQMINMRCNATEAERFLDYCRDVSVDYGVVIRLGRWDFDDDRVDALGDSRSIGYSAYCTRPWTSVVVLWNGLVVPCCHDYDGAVVLGDVTRQDLDEIWDSPEAARFRRDNYNVGLCQKCAYSRWYRDRQRAREGFRHFHLDRSGSGARREWINPSASQRVDGRLMFNGFDVLTADAPGV